MQTDSTSTPTLPRGERSRRSILEATLRVIARGGVDAVTHRRVAAEAGVSHGTTTYHFASRDEIVVEAFRHYIGTLSALFSESGVDLGHPTPERIVDFLVELVRREFADPELVLAEYELILFAARNEALAREVRAWERGLDAQLAAALEACGAPRPVEAARLIRSVHRAFELERLTHPDTSPEDLRRRLELLLPSLLAPAMQ